MWVLKPAMLRRKLSAMNERSAERKKGEDGTSNARPRQDGYHSSFAATHRSRRHCWNPHDSAPPCRAPGSSLESSSPFGTAMTVVPVLVSWAAHEAALGQPRPSRPLNWDPDFLE